MSSVLFLQDWPNYLLLNKDVFSAVLFGLHWRQNGANIGNTCMEAWKPSARKKIFDKINGQ